jgi:excinuclease ABC subunit A
MDKPRVDDIRGIPPAIAIEQANPVKSSRSTIGTMTEINDYLKLLWHVSPVRFARIATATFALKPRSQSVIKCYATMSGKSSGHFLVAVPLKTEPRKFFEFLQQQGYLRVWIDNQIVRVDADPKLKRLGARVQVIQDRITISEETVRAWSKLSKRPCDSGKARLTLFRFLWRQAYRLRAQRMRPARPPLQCPQCHSPRVGIARTAISTFDRQHPAVSFNNPLGACPECRGFGRTIAIDLNKAIPNRTLSIKQGVVRVFRGAEFGESQKDLLRACARKEIDINVPFEELPKADQDFVIEGEKRSGDYTDENYEYHRWYGVRGFFAGSRARLTRCMCAFCSVAIALTSPVPSCNGGRYQPEALNYKTVAAVHDRRDGASKALLHLTLPEFQALSVSDAHDFLRTIEIPANDSTARMLVDEICARLNYLCEVGVGYLTLDRSTRTLSGGEVQRVNLTTCLGASLVNTLFVMDEPSIGLHPRDVGRLVRVMHNLRDKGNTLLVVEHEEQIIHAADNLIDIGPGRGEHGGELVWNGTLDQFVNGDGMASQRTTVKTQRDGAPASSLTRDYLTREKSIPVPSSRRKSSSFIKIIGARQHNLKNIDVDLPLGVFTCVTGVSGSGKSTLIHDVLYRNLLVAKGLSSDQEAGTCKSIGGAHRICDVIMVDQAPLARTPRSTPLLYLGLYDRVRELFAAQPEAMSQGLTAGTFSFNSGSGRCERCSGTGYEKIEMQF